MRGPGPIALAAVVRRAANGAARRTARLATLAAPLLAVALVAAGVPAAAEGAGQATRGAEVYAFSCATCHGPTGQGFEEAVASFPEGHRDCARCHHPGNAAQMPGSQVGLSEMAFALGDPPPLADRERLARFGTAGALYEFVRAAMPRWAPASLDDADYLDVTAHLLRLAGLLGEEETLDAAGAAQRSLE
jgi:mono/diheme cytochrome c family protein